MSDDVSATLDALERKLRDLERELAGVAAPPAVAPPAPSRGEGLEDLAADVDDLGRYRERLARTARSLEEEYGRVLSRLEALVGAPAPAATSSWVIDAGPFADLAALGAFEQRLAALGTVEVTGFEGRRAVLELRPDGEVDLAAALADADVHVEAPGHARVEL